MSAALDAITRTDLGVALPGDSDIADVFDRHLQWPATAFELGLLALDEQTWCCVDGGEGGA